MTDPEIRWQELHRRVNDRYLSGPCDRRAYATDAEFHAQMENLRWLLVATEMAMTAENIPQDVRDRVIYRLLYGEAPAGYEAPDWRDAQERVAAREAETVRRMQQPARFILPEGWVR
jgi:hypothetical protein